MAAILDFPPGLILAIFHLQVNLLLHRKFQQVHLVVCEYMPETNIQDGSSRGHLGFLINMILAHFHPEYVLLLQSKFLAQIHQRFGKRCQNLFFYLRWWLCRPSWIFDQFRFSYFVSIKYPDAPHQNSTYDNWIIVFRADVRNIYFLNIFPI